MAEGDTTGRGGTPTPDGHPTGERDAADRERRSDAGKKRGTGGEESPEVFARPSWDHAKDFPEPLAEGRTSTAVAIGLVAAALLGSGLWLATREPKPAPTQPVVVVPTAAPVTVAVATVQPTAVPTWAPLGSGAPGEARPAPTLVPVVRPTPGAPPASGPSPGVGDGRPRRPRPTPARAPDPRREEWRQNLERFREERKAIQQDSSLSREQKRERLADLIRHRFRLQWPVPPPPPAPAAPAN